MWRTLKGFRNKYQPHLIYLEIVKYFLNPPNVYIILKVEKSDYIKIKNFCLIKDPQIWENMYNKNKKQFLSKLHKWFLLITMRNICNAIEKIYI